MLNQLWTIQVQAGGQDAVVAADGIVKVLGVPLRLKDAGLEPGTAVHVWFDQTGECVCAAIDEIKRAKQALRDAEEAKEKQRREQRRQQLNAERTEAQKYNARITLPVRWDVGRWNTNRYHIYLLEPLTAGRLKRTQGDYLCGARSKTDNKWYDPSDTWLLDGDGNRFQPKVTCTACLALAQRWKWMKESS